LATGEKILVEASPYDKIWGIGFNKSDALVNKLNFRQISFRDFVLEADIG
jgi:predicted NAD-dependent protein-ADP-ribosyltransferase YbiA (DUF1768 family)